MSAAGAAVASLVESDRTWVEANFKETQLAGLKVGQPVAVTVDAYPGQTLQGAIAEHRLGHRRANSR